MVSWKGGEHGDIPIIVYGQKDVKIGYPGESHQQLGSQSEYAKSELRAYLNPESNYMQITSHGPDNIPGEALGWLYADENGLGIDLKKTRVNFLGYSGSKRLGEVFKDIDERDERRTTALARLDRLDQRSPSEPMEEQLTMPSGRIVRYGDRRSVKVRGHLRRRIVDHLEHPPGFCMCKRSKWVDRRRKGLIRRLRR